MRHRWPSHAPTPTLSHPARHLHPPHPLSHLIEPQQHAGAEGARRQRGIQLVHIPPGAQGRAGQGRGRGQGRVGGGAMPETAPAGGAMARKTRARRTAAAAGRGGVGRGSVAASCRTDSWIPRWHPALQQAPTPLPCTLTCSTAWAQTQRPARWHPPPRPSRRRRARCSRQRGRPLHQAGPARQAGGVHGASHAAGAARRGTCTPPRAATGQQGRHGRHGRRAAATGTQQGLLAPSPRCSQLYHQVALLNSFSRVALLLASLNCLQRDGGKG